MKKVIFVLLGFVSVMPAFALESAGTSRRSMASQMNAAPRATASVNQLNMMSATVPDVTDKSSVRVENVKAALPVIDMREKEKAACINNNIGIGNTFVWASRYSNTNNYASMTEDVVQPDNNTCFVRVELKSNDSRISVADISGKYYEMGSGITCGAWVDENMMRERILDAKKKGRTWGTIGGAVGGAGLGVGAMELFGNKAIGRKVEGQAGLSKKDQLRSQILVLRNEGGSDYETFKEKLKILKTECADSKWSNAEKPEECKSYDYEALLKIMRES